MERACTIKPDSTMTPTIWIDPDADATAVIAKTNKRPATCIKCLSQHSYVRLIEQHRIEHLWYSQRKTILGGLGKFWECLGAYKDDTSWEAERSHRRDPPTPTASGKLFSDIWWCICYFTTYSMMIWHHSDIIRGSFEIVCWISSETMRSFPQCVERANAEEVGDRDGSL